MNLSCLRAGGLSLLVAVLLPLRSGAQDFVPPNWYSGYVMTNGIRTHFYRTGGPSGNGKPVMVLAHGFSDSALCWTGIATVLEDRYDIVLYDERGHGRTDAPRSGYTSEDRAEDLRGLIDALELDHPVLMGHSMGGSTVLAFALRYPEVPRAVILEDSGLSASRSTDAPTAPERRYDDGRLERERATIMQRNRMTIEELTSLCRSSAHANWTEPSDCVQWAWAKHEQHPYSVSPDASFSVRSKNYAGLSVPVLFLKAETEMGTGRVYGEETRQWHMEQVAAYPSARLVYVEGAGHNLRRDQKAGFLAALLPFLESLK